MSIFAGSAFDYFNHRSLRLRTAVSDGASINIYDEDANAAGIGVYVNVYPPTDVRVSVYGSNPSASFVEMVTALTATNNPATETLSARGEHGLLRRPPALYRHMKAAAVTWPRRGAWNDTPEAQPRFAGARDLRSPSPSRRPLVRVLTTSTGKPPRRAYPTNAARLAIELNITRQNRTLHTHS